MKSILIDAYSRRAELIKLLPRNRDIRGKVRNIGLPIALTVYLKTSINALSV